jgi:translation initiation factor IF-2
MAKKTTAKLHTEGSLSVRPPVVVVMGHIDHGKSSLLDYIRKTNIIASEAGGITQHVSAYEVLHEDAAGNKKTITFLDTPGHEAFQALRVRGVKVADIAILVVSAEDGVKPQTLDALAAIKTSNLPYIVAINKIDLPNANIDRTKQSLAEHEIFVENYGGDVPCVPISAKSGEGIPELLDMLLLVADMGQFSGNPHTPATGVVLESRLDPKKGIAATLIIRDGEIKSGQYVVSGSASAPVRIMENFLGKNIKHATMCSPVLIIGWDSLPAVGDQFVVCENRKEAEARVAEWKESVRAASAKKGAAQKAACAQVSVPLVLRADVAGSLEAILAKISSLSNDCVEFTVISSGIGAVTENDIKLAQANPNTLVASFHTKIDSRAASLAENSHVQIHQFDIIYKLIEWLANILQERRPHVEVEESTGIAKVVKLFSSTKNTHVIGGKVESGVLVAGANVKIMRRDAHIGDGRIKGMQRFKEKAHEAEEGQEFGAMIDSRIELAPGDRIESVRIVKKQL